MKPIFIRHFPERIGPERIGGRAELRRRSSCAVDITDAHPDA